MEMGDRRTEKELSGNWAGPNLLAARLLHLKNPTHASLFLAPLLARSGIDIHTARSTSSERFHSDKL
jgi:hypothetical protein